MKMLWAKQALLENGWADDVLIEVDDAGIIVSIKTGCAAQGMKLGSLLPAPANLHSHAFQRAMAGLTERRGPNSNDSFWTWRQLMFKFLDQLTPDHIEAIAAFVQMEMLEAGYANNTEFHYLHHQPGGSVYDKLSEMSDRITAAADSTGIGLTLLPVHYQFGGCDQRPLGNGQIRFGNDTDQFARLFEQAKNGMKNLPSDAQIGVAPHSLRAVTPESLTQTAALAAGGPVHIHLAEQIAEVEEVQAAWGQRPVEWLLDNVDVNPHWCLIHCTQMQPHETIELAQTGAVAGLCPITEASLGDGIFDAVRWLEHGGRMGIGSDSNIRISLSEELRTLDYSQRLRDHSRAALATPELSTGRRLFEAIAKGGAQAAGRNAGRIAVGALADLVALSDDHVDLSGRKGDTVLDCYIFAGDDRMITDVWSAGRHLVQEGQHINNAAITARYKRTMADLKGLV